MKETDKGLGGGKWAEMYHYFYFRKQEFLNPDHNHSNLESTFSMMKRKVGDNLRSKIDVAMVNENTLQVYLSNLSSTNS